MRIISGEFRGRRINPPKNLPVRPTTDFAKEGIFNVLNHLVDYFETDVADLFAGTGNMSFEFISRGCPTVTSVDIEQRCVTFIGENARRLGMDGLQAVRSNVYVFLKHPFRKFDLVFADPPYDMPGISEFPGFIMDSGVLKEDGLLVMEHSERYDFSADTAYLQSRAYGKVHFTIFKKNTDRNEG
jgi:16S rRNA (guanine966-N2)-methyltransferase